jgi:hypothetical protein
MEHPCSTDLHERSDVGQLAETRYNAKLLASILSLDPSCRQPRRRPKHHVRLLPPRTSWRLIGQHSPRQAYTHPEKCQLADGDAAPASPDFVAMAKSQPHDSPVPSPTPCSSQRPWGSSAAFLASVSPAAGPLSFSLHHSAAGRLDDPGRCLPTSFDSNIRVKLCRR